MTNRAKNKRKKSDIYEKYRRTLRRPDLTNEEIDEMRKNLNLLARSICEHAWGKVFH